MSARRGMSLREVRMIVLPSKKNTLGCPQKEAQKGSRAVPRKKKKEIYGLREEA